MKKAVILLVIFTIFCTALLANDNVIRIKSPYGFTKTLELIKKHLQNKNFTIIKTTFYKNNKFKKALPSALIIFEKHSLENKLIIHNKQAALEFPFKVFITKDLKNNVWIIYKNFNTLKKYGIPQTTIKNLNLSIRRIVSLKPKKLIRKKVEKKLKKIDSGKKGSKLQKINN